MGKESVAGYQILSTGGKKCRGGGNEREKEHYSTTA
jgi:hypothetical protein